KGDRRARGLSDSKRHARRARGDSEIRPTGLEELDGRRRGDIVLAQIPSAPDVLEELGERVVSVSGRGLVGQVRGGADERGVDVRRRRVAFVERDGGGSLVFCHLCHMGGVVARGSGISAVYGCWIEYVVRV